MSDHRNRDARCIGIARASFVESLEGRRLLTIALNGTVGADNIVLADNAGDLIATLNGVPTSYGPVAEDIVINGLAGADTITVVSMPVTVAALTINGGAGADTITGSTGDDTINGGDGADNEPLDTNDSIHGG